MVRALLCAMVVLAAVSFASARPPDAARACSIARLTTSHLAEQLTYVPVVAVGTLENREGNAITLNVEEGIKGATAGERLTVNNALNLDCYEAVSPGRQNYEQGARVLMFLESDTHGVAEYKAFRFGHDVFLVEGDLLRPYTWLGDESPIPRAADVREHFATLGGIPYEPGLEEIPPCNPPPWPFEPTSSGDWSKTAAVLVIGTTGENRDGATVVHTDEVFKGEIAAEFTLNDHVFFNYSNTGCRSEMGERNIRPEGTRVALALVRDDYGVAEWRPAAWGHAIWTLNELDEDRYAYLPLLSDVRVAAGVAATPTLTPPESTATIAATPTDVPAAPDSGGGVTDDAGSPGQRWTWIAFGGAAIACAIAAWTVRRRARL